MKLKTVFIQFLISVKVVGLLSLSTQAQTFHDIPLLGEYSIPDSFCFSVSDTCSGHDSIRQATAREDGWFAVRCICTHSREKESDIFYLNYVDIYDQNGIFQQELCYYTRFNHAIELTENSLDFYFRTHIINYNLETGSLTGFSIPMEATMDDDLLVKLQKSKFSVGQWKYQLSGGWMDHNKLKRTNGEIKQTLIDYTSASSILHRAEFFAFCGLAVAAFVTTIYLLCRKRTFRKH